jgi:hypothetical protein
MASNDEGTISELRRRLKNLQDETKEPDTKCELDRLVVLCDYHIDEFGLTGEQRSLVQGLEEDICGYFMGSCLGSGSLAEERFNWLFGSEECTCMKDHFDKVIFSMRCSTKQAIEDAVNVMSEAHTCGIEEEGNDFILGFARLLLQITYYEHQFKQRNMRMIGTLVSHLYFCRGPRRFRQFKSIKTILREDYNYRKFQIPLYRAEYDPPPEDKEEEDGFDLDEFES